MTTLASSAAVADLRGNPSLRRLFDRIADPRLRGIADRVEGGERLSRDEGLLLFETPELHVLLALADLVRRRQHGAVAYYNINRHLNYSNICALSCSFCAFYRKRGEEGAYERSIDEIRREAEAAAEAGATEMHIVGGLHPWLPFEYYLDMLRTIRAAAPSLHIKAFTAVEIVHLARITRRWKDRIEGLRGVLSDLREAGLGSLPGGGAEVFDDRVHDEAFKGKIRSDEWLDVHRAAHELGLNSNATILYGHIEARAERIHHMMLLREQQDRTLAGWAAAQRIERKRDPDHGRDAVVLSGPDAMYPRDRLPRLGADGLSTGWFQTIIPLPFFPDQSALEHLPGPSGLENLRTLAVARLMLDNFPHVKAFWIMQTLPMAQLMLQNGADDIDGTVVWYDITKAVGEGTHQEVGVAELRRAIREAGFAPVERDTLYRRVLRDGSTWSIASEGR
ncbi:MAG TPA: radical SAM protein [Phycisphaerales bacterium]|nr:radical SAM protein [Phycisphaerales bacterium]HMP37220.1 radical SAM protein [Phycisphaerales bacterium]